MPGILILTYNNLNEPASGGKRRMEELLRALEPRGFLCQPAPMHPSFPGEVYPWDAGRRKVGINWGIFNLYLPANRLVVKSLIQRIQPRAIVLTSIWCYTAVRHLGVPLVLDAQNVDAVAIEERFGRRHPFALLVGRQEQRVVRGVQHVFCCSEVDASLMRQRYGLSPEKITVAPNGTHLPTLQTGDSKDAARPPSLQGKTILFFMGKLDYAPNTEGVAFIRERLMPELERREPGRFICLICGGPRPATPDSHLIQYLGRVPAVDPWLRLADICLAPVFSGSGTRLKILEYLAYAKPVVATHKAAEGVTLRDNVEIAMREPASFAEEILDLTHHPEKAARIGERGRAVMVHGYSWSTTHALWQNGLERF